MGGENQKHRRIYSFSHLFLVVNLLIFTSARHDQTSPSSSPVPSSPLYVPPDNYLIACGSGQRIQLDDGRTFKSDPETTSLLQSTENIKTSVDSISPNDSSVPSSIFPLCRNARIFSENSMYSFYVTQPGRHWVRLYFYPLSHPRYNLTAAVFSVNADKLVLLHDFSVRDNSQVVYKEYLINITGERFSLEFKHDKGSCSFINAIEIVSVPDSLISDSASTVPSGGSIQGLSNHALQVLYRLNVGGPTINPKNDTLTRTWIPDTAYNAFPQGAQNTSVPPGDVKYPQGGATPFIAPAWVYATADQMANSQTMQPNFNLTWNMTVHSGFSYLIRMHFCDIVSSTLNDLYFNVYINGLMAVSGLDLSRTAGALSTAYYIDFVLNASAIRNDTMLVQVGTADNINSGTPNAILNGLEVMKMSDSAGSLDGLFSIEEPHRSRRKMKIVAVVGLAMGVTAMLCLAVICIRWQRRPQDWERRNSFSSWLLPLHSSHTSFLSSRSISQRSSLFGSRKSKSFYSSLSNQGLGRFFTYNELQNATQNFDEKNIIGVGGFGKVFLGVLEHGVKVAVKRGNQGSEQGINEFQTEIQMLSKLRHRHLVSLIGFCDDQSEMILVYKYMANGPLRDHLYGSSLPTLSWKQRLEICIGSARGLHYLHTGAAQGIIHRDVKTTNILLDENLVAKVADFGLSKAAPMEQGYVSTAVKGSFGYLDPEYFRRQQLTEKSDVYSFGVVLFEVLCARQLLIPTLPREQANLAEWAMQCHRKGLLDNIIDPHIAKTICAGSLKKYVEAAEKCLAEHGVDRPGMGDVLWNLEYALQLQEASSQIDPQEDKSTNLIALEKPSPVHFDGSSAGAASDDSEVVVASPPVFSDGEFPMKVKSQLLLP